MVQPDWNTDGLPLRPFCTPNISASCKASGASIMVGYRKHGDIHILNLLVPLPFSFAERLVMRLKILRVACIFLRDSSASLRELPSGHVVVNACDIVCPVSMHLDCPSLGWKKGIENWWDGITVRALERGRCPVFLCNLAPLHTILFLARGLCQLAPIPRVPTLETLKRQLVPLWVWENTTDLLCLLLLLNICYL